jgi:hypothetical protein
MIVALNTKPSLPFGVAVATPDEAMHSA